MAPRANAGSTTAEAAPTIQTVQRAALILSAFTVNRPHLSLNEITERVGTSKATAHRYTKALRAANLLRYDQRTSLFSLGPHILTLDAAARAGLPIVAAAGPYMEQLMREVDETVVLSIWDGDAPIVVRSVDNTNRMVRISVRTGSRLDLTTSAQGRVFCTYLPREEVPGLAKLLRRSPELRDELRAIREQGVSTSTPAVNGMRTLAAPVFQGGDLVAAMGIVGTIVDVPDDVKSPLAKALRETTRALSERLGLPDTPDPGDA